MRHDMGAKPTKSRGRYTSTLSAVSREAANLLLLKPLVWRLTDVTVHGVANLDSLDGAYIVVANHVTEVDPLTVAYPVYRSGTIPRFLAKESLFRVPVLGALLRATAQIPVYRGSMDANRSLKAARAVVDAGGAVIIYPEGTLTRDPDLWPMAGRTGAARLALATGAPVIPVAHWGDQELLPPHASRPRLLPRKSVRTLIGAPLELSDLVGEDRTQHVDRAVLTETTERMMSAITQLLEQLRGESAPPGRWDPRQGRRVSHPER